MHGWHRYFTELGKVWDRYHHGGIPASIRDRLRADLLTRWKAINAGLEPLPTENA